MAALTDPRGLRADEIRRVQEHFVRRYLATRLPRVGPARRRTDRRGPKESPKVPADETSQDRRK